MICIVRKIPFIKNNIEKGTGDFVEIRAWSSKNLSNLNKVVENEGEEAQAKASFNF